MRERRLFTTTGDYSLDARGVQETLKRSLGPRIRRWLDRYDRRDLDYVISKEVTFLIAMESLRVRGGDDA